MTCWHPYPPTILAQGCTYPPGDVLLLATNDNPNDFYKTRYLLVREGVDTIVQVQDAPVFPNTSKGDYLAYAVNYKIRDSIFLLEPGRLRSEVYADCLDWSAPFPFSVCGVPQLVNLEGYNLYFCADEGAAIELSDSIHATDPDGLLDTFTLSVSIISGLDAGYDQLDVDISQISGLQKNYISPTLVISNIPRLSLVDTIARNVFFSSESPQSGNRIIAFQLSDGTNQSNSPQRIIELQALPQAPNRIYLKRGEK